MIRATEARRAGAWSGPASDDVTLDHDSRHRRRLAMTGAGGLAFLLDLAEATALRDGDGLVLEDGRIVAVRAAPEKLAEITARDTAHLVRIAWHLGNRHLPTQLLGDRLRIRRDHVIEAMARGLGAEVAAIEAPFDPEGGAYGDGHGGHAQAHAHAHADGGHDPHGHDGHAHSHSHPHPHPAGGHRHHHD